MEEQELQLIKLREILLDESQPYSERRDAQKKIMEILDLKEKLSDGECTPEKLLIKRR